MEGAKKSRPDGPDGSKSIERFVEAYLLIMFSTMLPMIGSLNISWL